MYRIVHEVSERMLTPEEVERLANFMPEAIRAIKASGGSIGVEAVRLLVDDGEVYRAGPLRHDVVEIDSDGNPRHSLYWERGRWVPEEDSSYAQIESRLSDLLPKLKTGYLKQGALLAVLALLLTSWFALIVYKFVMIALGGC